MKLKRSFMLKYLIFLFLLSVATLNAKVLVTTKDIKFKQKIDKSQLVLKDAKIPYSCVPIKLEELEQGEYTASRYILKNKVLCQNDVKKYGKESVVFKFGALEIEKKGRIIFENDEYLRIKKQDGTVEKIFKDGIQR